MLLNSAKDTTVIISANIEDDSQEFELVNDPKAFAALSSIIYKNKIGSIVRELCSNAYDSHIAAGKKDVPFEVHLPSAIEPWFSVKDYGVGMSHDTVNNILRKYFCSTKDKSNSALGAFGIGFKSFLSYTDIAGLCCIHNGSKNNYSVYREDGIPKYIRLNTESTDESNGVEINFAVNSSDFHKFREEVQTQLNYFKSKPKILNGIVEYSLKPNEIIFENENFILLENGTNNYYKQRAILDVIPYELENNQFESQLDYNLRNFISSSNAKIIYKFGIGDLDVILSREGLEYTKKTIKNICNKIEKVYNEVHQVFKDKLDKIDGLWNKNLYLKDFGFIDSDQYPKFESRFLPKSDLCKIEQKTAYGKVHTTYNFELCNYTLKLGRSKLKANPHSREYITPYKALMFFYVDLDESDQKRKNRIRKYLENNHTKELGIFSQKNGILTPEIIKELSVSLGDVEIRKLSELELPIRTRAVRSSGPKKDYQGRLICYKLLDAPSDFGTRLYDGNSVKIYNSEEIGDGYFINSERGIITNKTIDFFDAKRSLHNVLGSIMNYCKAKKVDLPNFYIFNDEDFIPDDLEPIEIFIENFEERIDLKKIKLEKYLLEKFRPDLNSSIKNDWRDHFFSKIDKINKNNVFWDFYRMNLLNKRLNRYTDYYANQYFRDYLTIDISNYGLKQLQKLNIIIKKIDEKLPLLDKIGYYVDNSLTDHIIEYINKLGAK